LEGEYVAHLSLSLLGPFQATIDGQQTISSASTHLRALLAYLAVESGRAHSREALAAFLWPQRSNKEALAALRYALSNLRRVIGDSTAANPFLLITRNSVQFNRASDHWLDIDEFSSLNRESASSPGVIDKLSLAADLYRDEFLAGLALGDSPAFEEWLLLKREQFHRQALDIMQQLTAFHEPSGAYELAAASARRYLALEPWDEGGHRRLMRILALNGKRGAALAQYETCRRLLGSELGVDPEDETIRLYERIRDGSLPSHPQAREPLLATSQTAPVSATLPPAALFLERESELARLEEHLALTLSGQGRVVFVSGEAGSGKTTLLAEFVRRALAAHSDLVFAAGRGAAQAGMGDPYLLFREILGMLTGVVETSWTTGTAGANQAQQLEMALPSFVEAIAQSGPALLDTLVSGEILLRRVSSLVPDATVVRQLERALHARHSQSQPQPPGQPADFFAQVSHVLQSVARPQPLLLVLDDLQWADSASISLLFHLGRQIGGSRILVACAYRPSDLLAMDERHVLLPIIHEFQREWGETEVDLEQADGGAFVNAYLDSEPNRLDDKFRTRLFETVGGNPLFTVELVRRLQEEGHLTRDSAGYWVADPDLDWGRMPGRVEAVVAERLGRLPPDWRAILDVASVVGEEFEAELVARVLGAEEHNVLRTLGGPLSKQQRLVHMAGLGRAGDGRRSSRYRFRHSLFKHYLYFEMDEAERASLHELVAGQLLALHGEMAADLAPWLAWHYEGAGVYERAADYCLKSGQRAYSISAHQEAIEHFRHGLALLDRLPQQANPTQQPARLRRELALQLGLARPLGVMQGWASPEQVATYERAYELAHELDVQGEMDSEYLLAFHGQIAMAAFQNELDQTIILSEHLFALAQPNQNPLGLGLAHWGLGTGYVFRGECALGREHLDAAVSIYYDHLAGIPDVDAMDMAAKCLTLLALDLCFLGYVTESLERGREAIAMARRSDDPTALFLALAMGGCGPHICWRQPQEVQEIAIELQSLAHERELLSMQAWLEIALGWCQVETGDLEAGIVRMERGTRAWKQMGTVMGHFWHLGLLAEAHAKAGRVEEGLVCVEEGLALVQRVGYGQYEPELHRLRGELLQQKAGLEAEAAACFQQAIEIARRQETRWWELRATTGLARLWQEQGSTYRRQAREMLVELLAWFGEEEDLPDLRDARSLVQDLAP
jgi:DNA-binding SARP family transcriptional activator